MQEDVTNARNVSNRRIFKPTNHLYCENTATVDFVAIFFSLVSSVKFQVSGFAFQFSADQPFTATRRVVKAFANRRPQI
jgi:hypothetical protein